MKLTDLPIFFSVLSTKACFLLVRMYFTGDGNSQNFLVFSPMLNSLTLDNNKKVNS